MSEEYRLITSLTLKKEFNQLAMNLLGLQPDTEHKGKEIVAFSQEEITKLLSEMSALFWGIYDAVRYEKWEEADQMLSEAIAFGAGAPAIRMEKAFFNFKKGNRKDGLAALVTLQTEYPGHAFIATTIGMLLLEETRVKEAQAYLETAYALDSAEISAEFGIACCNYLGGNEKVATAHFEQISLKKPEFLLKMMTSADFSFIPLIREDQNIKILLNQLAQKR